MQPRLTEEEKHSLVKLSEGVYVERDVLGVAEAIREYDENLRLKFITPENAGPTDAPYMITEKCPDGIERPVMRIWELNGSILERLYDADNKKRNVLQDLDGHNLSVEKENQRRYREEMDEAKDMMLHLLKSPKGRYSMTDQKTGNKLTFDDQEGIPAKIERK